MEFSDSDTVELINTQINEEAGSLNEDVSSPIFSRKKGKYIVVQLKTQENFNEQCEYPSNDERGFGLLHRAAKDDDVDNIKFLVDSGSDVNITDEINQQTPLHIAEMYGHVKSIKVLLGYNANANQCDNNGHTPLQRAIIYGGNIQIIEILIEKTDLLKEYQDGKNALHIAIQHHQVDVINLILDHEQATALISKTDKDGFTPFHLAVNLGHLDVVENFLNKLKIDITKTITQKKNVIHLAATTHNVALMILLLKLKDAVGLINKPDSRLRTPLHDAARSGQLGQVALLLDKGAKANTTIDGYTPLHYACEEGHLDVAKKLLERHPLQVHYCARNKNTALHLAAFKGHATIVKFLLDFGAPITHNTISASFLDLAVPHRQSAVASVVVKHNRWEECLDLVSPTHPPPIIQLIENLPEVALSVMDRSITSTLKPDHSGYLKTYNFKYLSVSQKPSDKSRFRDRVTRGCFWLILHYIWSIFTITDDKSLDVIKAILKSNHADKFLSHPLLIAFINLKWIDYGRLYIQTRAIVPTILTILLTVIVLLSDPPRRLPTTTNSTAADREDLNESVPNHLTTITLTVNFMYMVVLLVQAFLFIRLRKVFHWVHYSAELATIVFTAIFILTQPTQWLAGITALLCSWIGLSLFSSYFDVFGLYTIMFYDLLLRIVKAIVVGLYYIIGFGLVMYILIGDEPLYNTPWIAVYTTFFSVINGFEVSLLAEKDQDDTLPYKNATFVIALVLTVVLTVTLLSLMIGIAVRSTVSIQKDAVAYQTRLKVSLFFEIDPNIPQALKDKVIPTHYKVEELNSMTTSVRNIWNYVVAFFATKIDYEDYEESHKEDIKTTLSVLDDHVKELDTQIKSIQRQQDTVLTELKKLNLKTESAMVTEK